MHSRVMLKAGARHLQQLKNRLCRWSAPDVLGSPPLSRTAGPSRGVS